MVYIATETGFYATNNPDNWGEHKVIPKAVYWREVKFKAVQRLSEALQGKKEIYYTLSKTRTAYLARFFVAIDGSIQEITAMLARATGNTQELCKFENGLRTQASLDVLDMAIMNCGYSTQAFNYVKL